MAGGRLGATTGGGSGTAAEAGAALMASWAASSLVKGKAGVGGKNWGGCSRYLPEGSVMPATQVWQPVVRTIPRPRTAHQLRDRPALLSMVPSPRITAGLWRRNPPT